MFRLFRRKTKLNAKPKEATIRSKSLGARLKRAISRFRFAKERKDKSTDPLPPHSLQPIQQHSLSAQHTETTHAQSTQPIQPMNTPQPTQSIQHPQSKQPIRLTKPRKPIPSLPVELYRQIISLLPRGRTLYPLLLVNKTFHVEAEPLLYTNIELKTDDIDASGDGLNRRVRLFNHLSSKPRLAKLVHSFELDPFTETCHWPYNASIIRGYWTALNGALCAMSNLKEFTMNHFSNPPRGGGKPKRGDAEALERLFEFCTFRLRKVIVPQECLRQASSAFCSQHYVVAHVEELGITGELEESQNLQKTMLRLSVLEIMSQEAYLPRLVRPPRKVKALRMRPESVPAWPPGETPLPEIRSLRFGRVWSVNWRKLTECFPSLRFLQIDLMPTRFFEDINESAIRYLPEFHELRKIKFGNGAKDTWPFTELRRHTAERLFLVHPILQTVAFHDEEWHRGTSDWMVRDDPDEWKDEEWWN